MTTTKKDPSETPSDTPRSSAMRPQFADDLEFAALTRNASTSGTYQ
jgi:hypothetical protein